MSESPGVRRFQMPGWLLHPWTRTAGHRSGCIRIVSRLPVAVSYTHLDVYKRQATFLKERPKYFFPAALAGSVILVIAVLHVALPEVYNLLVSSLISFFGEQPVTTTVREARARCV